MLVTIATFRDPWEAHLFRSRLDADGILAVVADDHIVYANWPWWLAMGGVKVQVPIAAREEAQAVWIRCTTGACQAELEDAVGKFESIACPRCGSTSFRRRAPYHEVILLLILGFVWGIVFPVGRSLYRCAECHARWVRWER